MLGWILEAEHEAHCTRPVKSRWTISDPVSVGGHVGGSSNQSDGGHWRDPGRYGELRDPEQAGPSGSGAGPHHQHSAPEPIPSSPV